MEVIREKAAILLVAFALCAKCSWGLGLPSCTGASASRRGADPTLDDVLACQKKVRLDLLGKAQKAGGQPSDWTADRIDDLQREEVRVFLDRHPDAAQREARKQDDLGPEKDFVGYLKEAFDRLTVKLRRQLGVPDPPASPKTPGNARVLKKMIDDAKAKGLDEKAVQELQGIERGEAGGENVGQTLQKYNQRLNENMDPSMKKYFKRRGQKDESASGQ